MSVALAARDLILCHIRRGSPRPLPFSADVDARLDMVVSERIDIDISGALGSGWRFTPVDGEFAVDASQAVTMMIDNDCA